MKKSVVGLLATGLLCTAILPQAWGEESATPGLLAVMNDLGKHLQDATLAIAREDWNEVATIATRIATHPEPPAPERLRILGILGDDVPAFRQNDQQVKEATEAMRNAAERADGEATIAAYAKIQTACLSCHRDFRTRIRTAPR